MATAPSQSGDSSPDVRPPERISFRHRNAALVIRGRFSDPSAVSRACYEDVTVLVGFHVCTLRPSPSHCSSDVCQQEWRCASEVFLLSQLPDLRRVVPEHILGRPVLGGGGDDDDDDESLFAHVIDTFVRGHTSGRFSRRSPADAARDQTDRREVIFQVDVNLLRDERAPAIKKVTYRQQAAEEEEEEEEAAAAAAEALRGSACAICLEDFCVGEEVYATPCGHCFHYGCLGRWLGQKPDCPLCRSPVPFRPDFESVPPIPEHILAAGGV